jgi:hypothetical protein
VTLLALVHGIGLYPSEPRRGEAKLVPQTLRLNTEPNPSTVPRQRSSERSQNRAEGAPNSGRPDEDESRGTLPSPRDAPPPDEDKALKTLREQATQYVQGAYSLLFEHLGLTAQQKDALRSLLIDMQAEQMAYYSRGKIIVPSRTIGEEERLNRISGAIGDSELQEFLALERQLPSYMEFERIESLLQNNGVPLTDVQRDRLFKILAEARDQYWSNLPPGIDPKSIEAVEYEIAQRSEYERHVIELAPSVLTPNQLVNLGEQYQYLSSRRTNDLERNMKKRADNPNYSLTVPLF